MKTKLLLFGFLAGIVLSLVLVGQKALGTMHLSNIDIVAYRVEFKK